MQDRAALSEAALRSFSRDDVKALLRRSMESSSGDSRYSVAELLGAAAKAKEQPHTPPHEAAVAGSRPPAGAAAAGQEAAASSSANTSKKVCKYAESCVNFNCNRQHPPGRRQPCRYGDECKRAGCIFLHPTRGQSPPPTPNNSTQDCRFGLGCVNYSCNRAHPAGRRQACRLGVACKAMSCPFLHPKPTLASAPNPASSSTATSLPAASTASAAPQGVAVVPPAVYSAQPLSPSPSPSRVPLQQLQMRPPLHMPQYLHMPMPLPQAPVTPWVTHQACLMCHKAAPAVRETMCGNGHFCCGPCMRAHVEEMLQSVPCARDLFYTGNRVHCLANECPCMFDIRALALALGIPDSAFALHREVGVHLALQQQLQQLQLRDALPLQPVTVGERFSSGGSSVRQLSPSEDFAQSIHMAAARMAGEDGGSRTCSPVTLSRGEGGVGSFGSIGSIGSGRRAVESPPLSLALSSPASLSPSSRRGVVSCSSNNSSLFDRPLKC